MELEELKSRASFFAENQAAVQLTRSEVIEHWEELATMLQPAVDASRGDLTTFGLLHSCAHELAYIFVFVNNGALDGCLVASLQEYHATKVCFIEAYAGDLKSYYPYLAVLESWALFNGCQYMEGAGSKGAERLARRHGFYHSHQVYRKPLGCGGNVIQ